MKRNKKVVKDIKLKIVDFVYVDGDLLCVTIKDDRGIQYHGSLEREA